MVTQIAVSSRHTYRIFCFLIALAFLRATAVAQSCVPPSSGIIAWWPLDETSGPIAADIAGTHPAAYFETSFLPAAYPKAAHFAAGKVGGAIQLDGNNFLGAADSPLWAFGQRSFALEFWANFDSLGGGTLQHPSHVFIGNDETAGNSNKWFLAVGGGFLNFHINSPTLGPKFFPLGPFSPQVGRWYHIAITRNGDIYMVFVDGNPIGSAVNSDSIPDPNSSLTIGQAESLGFFRGKLDEITIYDRALTQAEIQAVVAAGAAGKCKPENGIFAGIVPSRGGDTGSVSVRINGHNFSTGTRVSLTRTGYPEIQGSPVHIINDLTLSTTFDLTDKARGPWDVMVANQDGSLVTIAQGFTIEEGHAPRLWVDIIGRGAVRAGRDALFWIVYGNSGNVDASLSQMFISIPRSVTADIDVGATNLFGINPQLLPVGYPLEEAVVEIGLNSIPSGAIGSFPMILRNLHDARTLRLRVSLIPPTNVTDPVTNQSEPIARTAKDDPMVTVIGQIWSSNDPNNLTYHAVVVLPVEDPDGVSRWYAYTQFDPLDNGTNVLIRLPAEDLADFMNRNAHGTMPHYGTMDLTATEARELGGVYESYRNVLQWEDNQGRWKEILTHHRGNCVGILEIGAEQAGVKQGNGFIGREWSPLFTSSFAFAKAFGFDQDLPSMWPKLLKKVEADLANQLETTGTALQQIYVKIVNSYDPNQKLGALGHGTAAFISGGSPLRYRVVIENTETANGPAQEVVITDQLDSTKLDLSTLSLGPITFGTHQFFPPQGSKSFAANVDLRPEKNLLVRIEASLDANSGLITWRFTSLDPATGGLPEDPFAGFLPPNVHPPEGEGSVLFMVMPKAGLPTGSEIRNTATIIFDHNLPIPTPEWHNTLDGSAPVSACLPLAATQVAPSFLVRWAGTDEGSGVKDFSILVSEDSGPFREWLSHTSAREATFPGAEGKTYSFYSVARDQTGNVEENPGTPDTVTQVITNHAPVAVCHDVTVETDELCSTQGVTPRQIDAGSHDPDGDPLALSVTPPGPYALGDTPVTVTAADGRGAMGSCQATIRVRDGILPTASCNTPAVIKPTDAPISFRTTSRDNCGIAGTTITRYGCFDPRGVRVGPSACLMTASGDTITIQRATAGDRILWTFNATDTSGNIRIQNCQIEVAYLVH